MIPERWWNGGDSGADDNSHIWKVGLVVVIIYYGGDNELIMVISERWW